MKKIILLMAGLTLLTGCGTKKEEEKPNENKENVKVEDQTQITEDDLKSVSNSIETTRKDDNTTIVKVTFDNKSEKDFPVTTIKLTIKKDSKELITTSKELDEKIPSGTTKKYEFEVNKPLDEISSENVEILWEMVD